MTKQFSLCRKQIFIGHLVHGGRFVEWLAKRLVQQTCLSRDTHWSIICKNFVYHRSSQCFATPMVQRVFLHIPPELLNMRLTCRSCFTSAFHLASCIQYALLIHEILTHAVIFNITDTFFMIRKQTLPRNNLLDCLFHNLWEVVCLSTRPTEMRLKGQEQRTQLMEKPKSNQLCGIQ